MEKMHFKFGHETGMIIVVGIVISLIIFATGYNMRRKNFFENITNISKFGLLGTFLTFVFYSLMTWSLFQIPGLVIDYRYFEWNEDPSIPAE